MQLTIDEGPVEREVYRSRLKSRWLERERVPGRMELVATVVKGSTSCRRPG
jgi:hypothetical protein